MIPRIFSHGVLLTLTLISLAEGLAVPEASENLGSSNRVDETIGHENSIDHSSPDTAFGQSSLNPSRKFGEEPTDRVLPVDQPLDYEDLEEEEAEQNEIFGAEENVPQGKDYCARVLRSDLIKILKKMRRSARQESETPDDSNLGYLDFDGIQMVKMMVKMMGSAMARNATAIDEHYKQLPTLAKVEVTDFIQLFTELLKGRSY